VLGQALGLTDAEFDALIRDDYTESVLFDEREKAVIAFAEAMTRNTAKRDGPAWGDMARLFPDREIVEIAMIIGLFNMINRLNDTFRTELESAAYNRRQHGAVGVRVEDLDAYVRDFPMGDRARPA
jgi:hypothetical protein